MYVLRVTGAAGSSSGRARNDCEVRKWRRVSGRTTGSAGCAGLVLLAGASLADSATLDSAKLGAATTVAWAIVWVAGAVKRLRVGTRKGVVSAVIAGVTVGIGAAACRSRGAGLSARVVGKFTLAGGAAIVTTGACGAPAAIFAALGTVRRLTGAASA